MGKQEIVANAVDGTRLASVRRTTHCALTCELLPKNSVKWLFKKDTACLFVNPHRMWMSGAWFRHVLAPSKICVRRAPITEHHLRFVRCPVPPGCAHSRTMAMPSDPPPPPDLFFGGVSSLAEQLDSGCTRARGPSSLLQRTWHTHCLPARPHFRPASQRRSCSSSAMGATSWAA